VPSVIGRRSRSPILRGVDEVGDFAEAVAHELRISGQVNETTMPEVGRVIHKVLGTVHIAGLQVTDDREMVRNLKRLPF
jgi:hypothetical protein